MSVAFKIIGTRTLEDEHKCPSCENSHITIDNHGATQIFCRSLYKNLKTTVVECNRYEFKGFAMENFKIAQLAYRIDINSEGDVTFRDSRGRRVNGGKANPRRRRAVRRKNPVTVGPMVN